MHDLSTHALVIGIDRYSHGIAPLGAACRDARAVHELLLAEQGYSESELLLDDGATAEAIFEHLEQRLPTQLEADSALLIYFAGHGYATGEGGEPQGFLLPYDAKVDETATWISMDQLRQALEDLPCRHLLLVLDCCFAGAFRWATSRSLIPKVQPLYVSQFDRYIRGRAWQVLTSASYDEEARDSTAGPFTIGTRDLRSHSDERHSPFAYALLRGLGGDADSSRGSHPADGVVTATELYQYVDELLRPTGRDVPRQTPGLYPLDSRNSGEFIFRNPRLETRLVEDPPFDPAHNPWQGLHSYDEEEAGLFFGRARVIADLLELFEGEGTDLISVVGPSGSGKSSLVKAGLFPALEVPRSTAGGPAGKNLPPGQGQSSGERSATPFRILKAPRIGPEIGPWLRGVCQDLEEKRLGNTKKTQPAHGPTRERSLVFIDQLEELYTHRLETVERLRYFELMRHILRLGAHVVVTVRSDFEQRLSREPGFGELFRRGRFPIPPLERSDLVAIVEGPAKVKAVYFEPASLVDELVDEVVTNAAALPMLSFTLAELYRLAYERRQATGVADRALRREDYEKLGGVCGSMHRRATEIYELADAETREAIRRLFLRMVALDGNRLARRRVQARELRYGPRAQAPKPYWTRTATQAWHRQQRVDAVLEEFHRARLIAIEDGFVEPAHDSLITGWELTEQWLVEYGSQRLFRRVWEAAVDWDALARGTCDLISGRVFEAAGHRPEPRPTVSPVTRTPMAIAAGVALRCPPITWAWKQINILRRLWISEPELRRVRSPEIAVDLNWLEMRFIASTWRWFRSGLWISITLTSVLVFALTYLLIDAKTATLRAEIATAQAEGQRKAADQERSRALDRARMLVARDLLDSDPTYAAWTLLELDHPCHEPYAADVLLQAWWRGIAHTESLGLDLENARPQHQARFRYVDGQRLFLTTHSPTGDRKKTAPGDPSAMEGWSGELRAVFENLGLTALASSTSDDGRWVAIYTAEEGWWRADTANPTSVERLPSAMDAQIEQVRPDGQVCTLQGPRVRCWLPHLFISPHEPRSAEDLRLRADLEATRALPIDREAGIAAGPGPGHRTASDEQTLSPTTPTARSRLVLGRQGVARIEDSKGGPSVELPGRFVSAALGPGGSYAATLDRRGRRQVWPVSPEAILQAVRAQTRPCLPVDFRRIKLGESDTTARQQHAACLDPETAFGAPAPHLPRLDESRMTRKLGPR